MSKYYTKTFRPAVAERVADILKDKMSVDHLDLTEELALLRVLADDVGQQYAKANEISDEAKREDAMVIAGIAFSSMLERVSKMAEAASRVQDAKVKIQGAFATVMASVINVVVGAAWEVFGDDYKVREFDRVIRAKLEEKKVPGYDGTDLTPDMDVTSMDDTIPIVTQEHEP
jgi:hypothetical protein